jgi:galactose mutarotase-like enzyme
MSTKNHPHRTPGPLIELSDPAAQSAVAIAPERGAIVTSFTVGGRELLYMDVGTLEDASKNVRGGIPVLFPSPGKLEQDTWSYGSHSGSMKQHGFARNLPWSITDRAGTQGVTLRIESTPATLTEYPWAFHLDLSFALNGACLRIAMRVENTGTETMPYALGFHPYFQVTDKAQTTLTARATQAFNNLTKTVEPFNDFDLTQPEVDLHLLDHRDPSCALLLADGARITVRASSDFARWVVWTLQGRDFVCLEPWTSPGNALNNREQLIFIESGQAHESWMEIEFSAARGLGGSRRGASASRRKLFPAASKTRTFSSQGYRDVFTPGAGNDLRREARSCGTSDPMTRWRAPTSHGTSHRQR